MASATPRATSSSWVAPPRGASPTAPFGSLRGAGPALVGHAGLAVHRLRGTPDRRHLERAATLGLDRLEIDLCHTADSVMVVRHDHRVDVRNVRYPRLLAGSGQPPGCGAGPAAPHLGVAAGTAVADLPLQTLRRLDPELLTLDEAVDVVGGRVPLLLDVKVASVAPLLGRWLRCRRDVAEFAACTPSLAALRALRAQVPAAERWPTMPEFGRRHRDQVVRMLASLWLSHQDPARVRDSLVELGRAAGSVTRAPQHAAAAMAALPWRWRLPGLAASWSRGVAASGLCVPHWLVTPELADTARRLGLWLTAFTVNEEWAVRRVLACGVSMITSDEVVRVRGIWARGADPARIVEAEPARVA
jgi:glycerophosphoryl diester phosphodiesterase